MHKFFTNRRNITIIASYLFLTAVFFAVGYGIGITKKQSAIIKETTANVNSSPYESSYPVHNTESASYRVILEDSELRLYLDSNSISRLISAEKISEASYPVSDIAALKKGITFDNTEKAVELMENFIS